MSPLPPKTPDQTQETGIKWQEREQRDRYPLKARPCGVVPHPTAAGRRRPGDDEAHSMTPNLPHAEQAHVKLGAGHTDGSQAADTPRVIGGVPNRRKSLRGFPASGPPPRRMDRRRELCRRQDAAPQGDGRPGGRAGGSWSTARAPAPTRAGTGQRKLRHLFGTGRG